ncbi:hypothetical protein NIES4074_63660 (plasmid) [Cylindrospermum sp. NIES-4074]|nr:hypothetical protein NIES4074_63660 [Cylindrospermum sp. NIES-4074]
MTHVTYSHQQLRSKTLPQLRQTYAEIGCTVAVQDKRRRNQWISAIASYQSTQIQKIAQAELDQHLTDQASEIAPELTVVKINDRHFEVYAGKWLVAYISYDHSNFITQRWVVMVNGEGIRAWIQEKLGWSKPTTSHETTLTQIQLLAAIAQQMAEQVY